MKRLFIFILTFALTTVKLSNASQINEEQLKPLTAQNEINDKRGRNVKYYDRGENITTAVISESAVHFKDEIGKWQNINTDVVTYTGKEGWKYQSVKNTVQSFWDDNQAKFVFGDKHIILSLDEMRIDDKARMTKKLNALPQIAGNEFERKNMFAGTNEIYTVLSDQIQFGVKITAGPETKGVGNIKYSYTLVLPEGVYLYSDGKKITGTYETKSEVLLCDRNKAVLSKLYPFTLVKDDDWINSINCKWKFIIGKSNNQVNIVVTIPVALIGTMENQTLTAKGSVSINPSADALIYSNQTSTNYGSSTQINVGKPGVGEYRSVLRFDLSAIPMNISISSAYLYCTENLRMCQDTSNLTTSHTITAYHITNGWTESGVTWDNINGSYISTYFSSALVDGTPLEEYCWNITNMTSAWYDGAIANYGLMLIGNATNYSDGFYSKESSYKPYLSVTYSGKTDLKSNETPPGWSSSIIVSRTVGSTSSDANFNAGDTVYISAAVFNNSLDSIVSKFDNNIIVNSIEKASWSCFGLGGYKYSKYTNVKCSLIGGNNYIIASADVNDGVYESNESNNRNYLTIKGNRLPSACQLSQPADGSSDVKLQPVFSWSGSDPDGDALTYYIQIAKDLSFTDRVYEGTTGASNSWTYPGNLSLGTTYYWRVKANDGQADGPWSSAFSFITTTKLYVSGTIKYDNNNYGFLETRPLSKLKIEFYDLMVSTTNPLDTTTTDESGDFDFGYVDGINFNSYDLHLKIILKNDSVCIVKDGYATGYPPIEILLPPKSSLAYTSDGSIYYNKSLNSEFTWPNNDPDNNAQWAACYIYDAIYKERKYFKTQAAACNPNLPPIDVYFRYNDIDSMSSFVSENNNQRIRITKMPCVMLSNGTVKPGFYGSGPYHEYAHAVMFYNYRNPIGAYVLPGSEGTKNHCPYDTTTPARALIEGWAEFVPCAVNDNKSYLLYWNDGSKSSIENIETNGWHTQKFNKERHKSDRIEGTVASILWDIYDAANSDEAGCEMTKNMNSIFGVLQKNVPGKTFGLTLQPEGMVQMYLAWDSLERPKLKNIYRNHWFDLDKLWSSADVGERLIYRNSVYNGNITTLTATEVDTENSILPHSGDKMYKIEGQDNSANDSYAWWKYVDLDISLAPGPNYAAKYLSFWIYVAQAPGGGGHIGFDLVTKKKGSIKDYSYNGFYVTDQYGQRLNPAYRTVPKGQWLHYVYDLSVLNPSIYPDDTLKQVLIGYDDGDPTEMGDFLAYVDDIEVNEFSYPTYVHGFVYDSTTANVTWNDNNIDEDGFLVWWKRSDETSFNNPPIIADSVPGRGNKGSCLVPGLTMGNSYNFMVRAKRGAQISAYEFRYGSVNINPSPVPLLSHLVMDNIPEENPIIRTSASFADNEGTITNYELERKVGLDGAWEQIKGIQYYYFYDAILYDTLAFNNDYYYRARTCNGIGNSVYSNELRVPIYFLPPKLTYASASESGLHIEWRDSMNTFNIPDPSGIGGYITINNPFYDGIYLCYKKATDSTWSYPYQYSNSGPTSSSCNFTLTLSPMTSYDIKIARVWNHSFITKTEFSESLRVFVPKSGYTNYNNARKLFHGGDNKLNASFYNGTQVYWASSSNNGLSWSVTAPKEGSNSTIAEKKSNKSIYSVRAKGDSLLLDSLGTISGFGKVIKTGSKIFNPAVYADSLGTIYCAWAETVVTAETRMLGWVRQYRVSDTIRVMYSKRTSSGWESPTAILPISVCATPWETIRPNSSIHSVIELPNPSIVVNKISGSMVPHIAWAYKHWVYDQMHRSWVCDTAAIYYSSNKSTGAYISASGQYAEAPCLSVNNIGNIALTYQQSGDIYRSTNNGSTWSAPYNISNNVGNSQMPSISYDTDGNMHVLWFDDSESGFIQKASTLPAEINAKLAIDNFTELPQGEEAIVWVDSSGIIDDGTLKILMANKIVTEEVTSVPNAVQIFYRRYKNNSWSSIYRLTSSEAVSVYPALPLTDNASQMGFLWTEGNAVKYKRLPDLDAPSVAVVYPNGGEVLYNGRRYNISWNCTDNRGIREYVLYYTANYLLNEPNAIDAATIWSQIAQVGGNANDYSWRVPYGISSTKCRFRVMAYDSSGNIAQDISDANFTINNRNIVPIRDELSLAYNNAEKLVLSSDGVLHLNYGDENSIYYISSKDDGKTWSTPLVLNDGSLPVIAVDSKNAPAISWIKQWEPNLGGGVYFSHKTATGWSPAETLAFMYAVPWDYICGYSPPAMSIKNDTVSLVYEKSYGGGIPPYVTKGWSLYQTRFALNNIGAKKDTILDHYSYSVPPPWAVPTSATMATDYKGADHIAWHKLGKIYYSMRKIDGTYSSIVEISGPGSAENPSINISGVANVVWEENGDIYKRTGYDQKWDPIINVSRSSSASMMPYVCGSDILWTEDVSNDYEVFRTTYSTEKMTYIAPDNLSSTDYASIFPHEIKVQTAIGTKTYCIWAEEIEPNVLWGLTFMVDTTALEPIYAVDTGQETPSIFNVQRDGFIVYGSQAKTDDNTIEPYKTVDYDSTELIYCFDNIDPDKKYRILLSFYHESGSDIKMKPYINDLPLGEIKVKSGEEVILDKQLSEASNRDGRIILRIEKHKGIMAVCGKILIHEVIKGNGQGGAQLAEVGSIGQAFIYKLYQNAPNPFNGQTKINYQLAKPGNVSLKIYNTLGQLVNTLVHGHQQPGIYSAIWNGKDNAGRVTASGIYFYRLESGDFKATKKMVVLK